MNFHKKNLGDNNLKARHNYRGVQEGLSIHGIKTGTGWVTDLVGHDCQPFTVDNRFIVVLPLSSIVSSVEQPAKNDRIQWNHA